MKEHRGVRVLAFAAAAAAVGLTACHQRRPADNGAAASARISSGVFTPAHRTLLGAVLDYFDYRPNPAQPIAYTHKVHLANGLQCTDCHAGADTGPDTTIPNIKLCMTCHQVIAADKPEIKKMAALYARGEDVSWQRVYNYQPEAHVRFNHAPHIRAGIDCKTCHGDMTQQTVARRVVDLNMGYCLDCHRRQGASVDCTTCHD